MAIQHRIPDCAEEGHRWVDDLLSELGMRLHEAVNLGRKVTIDQRAQTEEVHSSNEYRRWRLVGTTYTIDIEGRG